MSLPKFLPSFCFQTKSWQKDQSLSDSNSLADFNNVNKEFIPKNFPKKIFSKKSYQKFSPKTILPKNSSNDIPPKKSSKKFPKNFPKNSKKKSFQNSFSIKFLRFWKFPLPYIALNQVRVVAFSLPQLTQASFIQKNQPLQNCFLISVMLRWHRPSVACKNQNN